MSRRGTANYSWKKRKRISTASLHAEPFTETLEDNQVCMVCKLFLNQTDEILQCSLCETLYHKDHLLDWIQNQKNCPVCAQELYTETT